MRIPIRWNLRTLLVATLLIGLGIGGYELRQRSIRYRAMAEDYAKWDGKLTMMIDQVIASEINSHRTMVDTFTKLRAVWPQLHPGQMEKLTTELEHYVAMRSKFVDLREYSRKENVIYLRAARRPWESVPDGKAMEPMVQNFAAELFPDASK